MLKTDRAYLQNSSFVPSFPSVPLVSVKSVEDFRAALQFLSSSALFSQKSWHCIFVQLSPPTPSLSRQISSELIVETARGETKRTDHVVACRHWKAFRLVLAKVIHALRTFCGTFGKVNVLMLDF